MRTFLLLFLVGCTYLISAQPFTLPKLPYAYVEYAPNIDALTMEIHLTKHHQAYVNNLNKAVKGTPNESLSLQEILLNLDKVTAGSQSNDVLRNNAGGHYNHSLFWEILAPKAKQGVISDVLTQEITVAFGNMDSLKKELNKAAMSRFGSGWAWLVKKDDGKLEICSTPNQDNPLMDIAEVKGTPIMGLDVWEHAYYLHYQNRRPDYISAFWNLVNWDEVSKRFESK